MSSSGRSPLPTVNERDSEQVREGWRGSGVGEGGPGPGVWGEGRLGGGKGTERVWGIFVRGKGAFRVCL